MLLSWQSYMAETLGDTEKDDKVPVVLRVKRKRSDDPAESLGIHFCSPMFFRSLDRSSFVKTML